MSFTTIIILCIALALLKYVVKAVGWMLWQLIEAIGTMSDAANNFINHWANYTPPPSEPLQSQRPTVPSEDPHDRL